MRNALRTTLLALLMFALSCASGGGTTGTGGFDFAGKVLSSNGQPITGLEINIESPEGEHLGTTSTSSDGTFAFNGLATSDTVVKVKKPDGQTREFTVSIPSGSNKANLTLRQKPNGEFDRDDKFEDRPVNSSSAGQNNSSQASSNQTSTGKGSSSSSSSNRSDSSDDDSSSDTDSPSSQGSREDDGNNKNSSSESSSSSRSSSSNDDEEVESSSQSSSGSGKGGK